MDGVTSVIYNDGSVEHTLDVSNYTENENSATTTEIAVGEYFIRGVSTQATTKNNKKVIKMGGKLQKDKCYVRFTTTKTDVTVKVSFFNNSDENKDRKIQIAPLTLDSSDSTKNSLGDIVEGCADSGKNVSTEHTFTLSSAGTYAIGGSKDIMIEKIIVTEK